jgi:hypothetical protein
VFLAFWREIDRKGEKDNLHSIKKPTLEIQAYHHCIPCKPTAHRKRLLLICCSLANKEMMDGPSRLISQPWEKERAEQMCGCVGVVIMTM